MIDKKKHICKYCNKEFNSGQSLGAHIIHCEENPNSYKDKWINKKKKKYEKENPLQEYNLKCIACGKEYKLQLRKKQYEQGKYRKTCCNECSHKLSSLNTNLKEKNKKISEAFPKLKHIKICPICGKEFITTGKAKFCSQKCRNINTSNNMKGLPNVGGIRNNAYKKYKSGWYHNIHCDSSWELAFVIYCEDHNIKLQRNNKSLNYIYQNKEYKYYPDFIINNQLYEIKGYENERSKIKHLQHPEVIYLNKEKMKKYIDYVINKYGNNFIKLYDKLDKIAV